MTIPSQRPARSAAARDRFGLTGGPGGPPPQRTGASGLRMIVRGAIGRCPRCGGGHLFHGWLAMVERCGRCGHRFERRPETAFFLGAYTLNLGVSLVALMLSMFTLVARLAGASIAAWVPWALGGFAAVVLPIISYPFSKTLWAGIEMAMHPLDVAEEAEAALWLEQASQRSR